MVLSSALMGVALAMVRVLVIGLWGLNADSQYQVVNSIPASIGFNAME